MRSMLQDVFASRAIVGLTGHVNCTLTPVTVDLKSHLQGVPRKMSLLNGTNGNESPQACDPIVAAKDWLKPSRTVWDPTNVLTCPSEYKYAVLVLNRPIHWKHSLLFNIWQKAQVTATVDGGTDRWVSYLGPRADSLMNGTSKMFVPTLITGDMDSVSLDTLQKLKCCGATVIKTPDQNATDYTKALFQLGIYSKSKNIALDSVYVFAETSGRFDHIIANINTLFRSDKLIGDAQVIQVSSNSLTWLLKPGTHRIIIPDVLIKCKDWCALMPFGYPVTCITTTGLQWNLDHSTLEFGGIVSTSNTYCGFPEVTVTTDTPVIWSMGIKKLVESFENASTDL